MKRREFLQSMPLAAAPLLLTRCRRQRRPNVIFILADDLGYAELGCYGQRKIKTPNIDHLAAQGMRFLQHYSGSPVCAPSRCTLMTGLHTGHSQVRDNKQVGGAEGWRLGATSGGQWPLQADTTTVARIFQQAGYVTGAFGKWGLGIVPSTGAPLKQGFDHFYGYICQRQAHTYYPNHVWRDDQVEYWHENDNGAEVTFSHDRITETALQFIKTNKDRPFFCYVPFTIPHVALQVPEDSLAEYRGLWDDPPYDGKKGYVPHPAPRACYAAMVSRMDRDVGRIVQWVKQLHLENDTLIIFTSDNGPTFAGGADSTFFESTGGLRGLKQDVYEGGIRVPFIAAWPGHIQAGSQSQHASAFWDFMPTACELIGSGTPAGLAGISYLPTLLGRPERQKIHDHLYWELAGQQAVRQGDWKAVRLKMDQPVQLYNLAPDPFEKLDVAGENPERLQQMTQLLSDCRIDSELFPL